LYKERGYFHQRFFLHRRKIMARKRAGEVSKSDVIRTMSAAHPEVGPTELARMILGKHGLQVSPAMISTILSKERANGAPARKVGRPRSEPVAPVATPVVVAPQAPPASTLDLNMLIRLKQLSDEIGGVNQTKNTLEALSQILG
jgi:hypothetical protein